MLDSQVQKLGLWRWQDPCKQTLKISELLATSGQPPSGFFNFNNSTWELCLDLDARTYRLRSFSSSPASGLCSKVCFRLIIINFINKTTNLCGTLEKLTCAFRFCAAALVSWPANWTVFKFCAVAVLYVRPAQQRVYSKGVRPARQLVYSKDTQKKGQRALEMRVTRTTSGLLTAISHVRSRTVSSTLPPRMLTCAGEMARRPVTVPLVKAKLLRKGLESLLQQRRRPRWKHTPYPHSS